MMINNEKLMIPNISLTYGELQSPASVAAIE